MISENKKDALDLEKIIVKFWPQISFRVRKSIGYLTPDWEDVASEVILAVVEAIKKGKFREESSIGTFIYSITTNKIIDYIRRKDKAFKELPQPTVTFDPYKHVEKKEEIDRILKSLKKLKPKHADMLYLYYYLGLSQNQIGQIYNISPTRVSAVLGSAKRTLRKIIER